jgi:multidrug efflux system outer membrane protein
MISNRPDIQSAYYQVLSTGYMEKETIANFLPTVNITGNYGYASTALSNLLSHSNSFWNYGIYTSQFIFDYAIRMSEYQRAKFQYESAILNYKNTAINAFTQVDTALTSYKEDNEALNAYQNLGSVIIPII